METKRVVALFLAGLVAQSSVLSDENAAKTLPDFSYTNEKETLSLNATEGELFKIYFQTNDSNWFFDPSKDGSPGTLGNTVKNAAVVSIKYFFEAGVGNDEIIEGRLEPVYSNLTLNFALTASGDDKNCTPKFTTSSLSWDLGLLGNNTKELWLDDQFMPQSVRTAMESPGVLRDLENVLWEKLVGELPNKLTDLLNNKLPEIWSRTPSKQKLCKEILAATPEKFPLPEALYISAT